MLPTSFKIYPQITQIPQIYLYTKRSPGDICLLTELWLAVGDQQKKDGSVTMPIIRHADQPSKKGYYSKIINRQIVTSEVGATSFVLWEQVIPPGGYIVPHYHEFEEILTFLSGSVQATMGDECHQVEAGTTVFIRPYLKHSVLNQSDKPAKLMALLMSADPKVIYPDGLPEPVIWEDDT